MNEEDLKFQIGLLQIMLETALDNYENLFSAILDHDPLWLHKYVFAKENKNES